MIQIRVYLNGEATSSFAFPYVSCESDPVLDRRDDVLGLAVGAKLSLAEGWAVESGIKDMITTDTISARDAIAVAGSKDAKAKLSDDQFALDETLKAVLERVEKEKKKT